MDDPDVLLLSSSSGGELDLEDVVGDGVQVIDAAVGSVDVIDLCGSPHRNSVGQPSSQDRADCKTRRKENRKKRRKRRKWHQCFVPQEPLVNGARDKHQADMTESVEVNKASRSFDGVGSAVVIDLEIPVSKEDEITADLNTSNCVREVEMTLMNKMEDEELRADASKDIIDVEEEGKQYPAAKIDETAKLPETHRNPVLRKGVPRYFDYPEGFSEMCCSCNEYGHRAVNCPTRKRRCYICGGLGHKGKKCNKKYECSRCQKMGHLVTSCREKSVGNLTSKICVRCGDSGHDMISCRSNYSSDDLKKIQCYVCKNLGHICCVDFQSAGPNQVSCFRCGESGHVGLVCKNVLGDHAWTRPAPCKICEKEGHEAQKCRLHAKAVEQIVASSSSNQQNVKDASSSCDQQNVEEGGDSLGCQSGLPKPYVPPMKEIHMKHVRFMLGWG